MIGTLSMHVVIITNKLSNQLCMYVLGHQYEITHRQKKLTHFEGGEGGEGVLKPNVHHCLSQTGLQLHA